MSDDIPELTPAEFERAIPGAVRRRLCRGEVRSGRDVVALRRFVGMTQEGSDAMVAVPVLGAIGLMALLFFAVLSIPGIVAGWGLMKYQPWARVLTIVLSCLDLFNFPLGTALGVYGLWVLFSPQGSAMFQRQPLRPL